MARMQRFENRTHFKCIASWQQQEKLCVRSFWSLHTKRKGLFHRHFLKHKHAYDAFGSLTEDSQADEKEVNKMSYIY